MATDTIIDEPERIYLKCEIDFLKFPSEWQTTLEPFYRLFESEIFEWKETNFNIPESIFSRFNLQKVDLGINDCLNKDECLELSRDKNGVRLALNKEQFSELRRHGEIHVRSVQFPGKNHVWRINRLFQKGTEQTYNDFQKDLTRVARLVIITMRNRVFGRKFSMRSSFKHIWKGIYLLVDLLFGLPHNNHGNIDVKLDEECLQFLTCELNVAKMDQEKLSNFWFYLEQLSCLPKPCGADILKEYFPLYADKSAIPVGIYQFVTPNRLSLDLRLMNTSLELKCQALVWKCVGEVEQSNWFLEFKNDYVERVYHESLSVENIEKSLITEGIKAKANKIFDLIRLGCEEELIPETICTLMIENVKFHLICNEVKEIFKQNWIAFKEERFECIKKSNPYLSMISSWMRKQLKNISEEFLQTHRYSQLKMVIDKCASEDLKQHEYFTKRYLLFQKERKQLIYHELVTSSSFPDRAYEYRSRMVLPSYWKVTQSITSLGATCYEVNKFRSLHWTTRYPLWRWINHFLRTYMLMITIGQFLLITLPLKTRVSYLSLFCRSPFVTQYDFDDKTGSIRPSDSSKSIPTLCSRLQNLWNHVWKSRAKFESSTMTGLLDKSVARHFHRLWVVGFKGGVGTVGIVIIMPILCLLTSSFSVIFGALVPIWVPIGTVSVFLVSIFVYDLESPNYRKNRLFCFFQAVLWHGLWCGLLQLCFHVCLVTVIFPFVIVSTLILTFLRFSIRSSWDVFIFHLILKRHAHVPAANDFITKRISGPGLAYEYEILVQPEHVLTGLRCLMEKLELELWLKQVTKIIHEPLENYSKFIDKTLHPLNVTLNKGSVPICRLIEKESKSLEEVHNQYYKRLDMLNISPFTEYNKKERLRMSSKNLKIVLEKSEKLWQQFYSERLQSRLKQLGGEEDVWWNKKNVRKYDMRNLSLSHLSYLFGEQILSPIEECDEVFQLETNEITMTTYVDMFVTEDYQEDLDKINIISSNWNKGVSLEYCQFKLRDLQLPVFSTQDFFFQKNTNLPSPLESCPTEYKYGKKLRVKWISKSFNWMKGRGKGMEDTSLDEQISAHGGSAEIADMSLYHPVIICALLNLRDRDNTMVHIDHRAVYEGIRNSMAITYNQEFLESVDLVQSVDYSNNSLEDIYNDVDTSNCLLADNC